MSPRCEAGHALAGGEAALLVQKLQRGGQEQDRFPLSFAQQRLWVVHQMDPESPAYNMPYALRLRGTLDGEVLGRALTVLAKRHATLRTVFPAEGGVPVQRILPAGPSPCARWTCGPSHPARATRRPRAWHGTRRRGPSTWRPAR